jgi:hypothetical protein
MKLHSNVQPTSLDINPKNQSNEMESCESIITEIVDSSSSTCLKTREQFTKPCDEAYNVNICTVLRNTDTLSSIAKGN